MTAYNLPAVMFPAGARAKPLPGRPAPGTDRIYPSPGVNTNRTWGCTTDGYSYWVFGESSGFAPFGGDPTGLGMKGKQFGLRSLRLWSHHAGYFYIRNRASGTAWGNMPIRMKFRLTPGVTINMEAGLGTILGNGIFFEWVGDAVDSVVYAEFTYDIT